MKTEVQKTFFKGNRLVKIKLDDIRANAYQPRLYFDSEEINKLAQSIKQNGLIQPITVRRTQSGYELIAGERRLRALKQLGVKDTAAIVINADDEKSAVLSIVENIQRCDLNIFEQAEGLLRLIEKWNVSQSEAAQRLGISQSAVANKLRVLRMSQTERELVIKHSLTERHARALIRIKDDEKRLIALKTVIRRKMNVNACDKYVEKLIKNESGGKTKMAFRDLRIFTNTITHAVEIMRRSGINAGIIKGETDSYIEYKIKIPKANAVKQS